jgi:hypothetical protein
MGHPKKLSSPTKLAQLANFPPASQAGRLAGPVFYTISFLSCTETLFRRLSVREQKELLKQKSEQDQWNDLISLQENFAGKFVQKFPTCRPIHTYG